MAARRSSNKPTREDKLFGAFLAWFESDNGRLCLAWLKQTYHDRSSTNVDFDPHRALASEASRGVYLHIIAMIREAKKHATGESADIAQFDLDAAIDAAGTAIFEQ